MMSSIPQKESVITKKSYAFALETVKLYEHLVTDKKEYVLSKQTLRSGTSVGANVNEAVSGQSKRDFVYKLGIALKKEPETLYWLNLLKDSDYINVTTFTNLSSVCQENIKIPSSIILTTKEKYFAQTTTLNS